MGIGTPQPGPLFLPQVEFLMVNNLICSGYLLPPSWLLSGLCGLLLWSGELCAPLLVWQMGDTSTGNRREGHRVTLLSG